VRIPRDREGTFDPKLIQRYQRRFPGFDEPRLRNIDSLVCGPMNELRNRGVGDILIAVVDGLGAAVERTPLGRVFAASRRRSLSIAQAA
jgi:transposase-like protein